MRTIFLTLLSLLITGCAFLEPMEPVNETYIHSSFAGDTFIITRGEYVRLIGVNAPEKGESGYDLADNFSKQFEGMQVFLESEGEDRNKHGMLLRHAFVNNKSIAIMLLEKGYAKVDDSYDGVYSENFSKILKSN